MIQQLFLNREVADIMSLIKKRILFVTILFMALALYGCTGGNSVSDNTSKVDESVIENMAMPVDTGGIEVTEEMLDAGIFNPGDTGRLASVMARAASGEDITIAYIGGSITNGDSANPKETKCYAYLTTEWWKETFPGANINYVNAGIGATDSYIGVHRAKRDVLAYKPDLVVVEFSVNDTRNHNKETYESLLRMLLNSDSQPAVISLIITTEQGYDYASDHIQSAFNYKVPIISYKAEIEKGYEQKVISWDDIGSSDGVHPSNGGHTVIANLLTTFYSDVLKDINNTEYTEEYVMADAKTKCRYENADIIFADEMDITENDGFVYENVWANLSDTNGWVCTDGGSITFKATGKSLGIIYQKTTDGMSGVYDVYVDGEYCMQIDGDFKNGWGNCVDYVILGSYDESSEHTVSVMLNDNSENKKMTICAVCVAE